MTSRRAAIRVSSYQHPLVTIAWHAALLRDALVFDRRLEHHAFGELIDEVALDFLPRRLTVRIGVAAALLQRRAPLGKLGGRDQNIGSALVQIDAHAVAGLEQRESAAGGGFRRRVEDRGRARRAGLAAVADARKRHNAFLEQRGGRLHVDDFRGARIADRPDAADEQQGALVDLERRILDALVIVLRPVEYHSASL